MTKKAIHVRLDTELLAEIDKAADKMRPRESRTEYLERAAWQRIERERGVSTADTSTLIGKDAIRRIMANKPSAEIVDNKFFDSSAD
jgi:metal-responsive CopG/Arc/MetJ family transcriptional regulator